MDCFNKKIECKYCNEEYNITYLSKHTIKKHEFYRLTRKSNEKLEDFQNNKTNPKVNYLKK